MMTSVGSDRMASLDEPRWGFVPVVPQKNRNFYISKYLGMVKRVNARLIAATNRSKTRLKKTIGTLYRSIMWDQLCRDAAVWVLQALIDGFIITFALHVLFGFQLTVWSVLAVGFLVREALDLAQGLRRGTPTDEVSEPDNARDGEHGSRSSTVLKHPVLK
jgi:hypothetical protein